MKKNTMKWMLGTVLSLALLVGFAALDARPSWGVGTDVFNQDSKLYVPYWRNDADAFTVLVLENPAGPPSTPFVKFYDKNCSFVRSAHPPLTTDDVEFLDVSGLLSPVTGEGGIVLSTDTAFGGVGGAELTAETIVANAVNGSILRFHHINENDAGKWTTFANLWNGAYWDANFIDNELYLFCPGQTSDSTKPISDLAKDLIVTLSTSSPVGSATDFTKKVDIFFFDDKETLLLDVPLDCTCATRVLLHALTNKVNGKSGRIEITSKSTGSPAFPAGDNNAFIAFMKRQLRGTPFQVNGYMFSQ